tara:strand:- start:759 stop:1742 length:984 start_codon:yes stop_codon:yes gene_type:complete
MIARRLPSGSRVGATAIAYLMVVSLIGGFMLLVVPPVIEQSAKFADSVPGIIDDVADQRIIFDDFIQRYGLEAAVDDSVESAKNQAAAVAANLGNTLVGGAGALLSGLASLIIVLVLAFLMLIEGPTLLNRIWGLYEDPRLLDRHKNLVEKMYRVVTGFVNGQLAVAAIAAICTLVVLLTLSAVFGMPANIAIPLSVIIFVTGMIPMVGATIGGAIVALVLLFNSPVAALIFLVYFVIYQQIENNFISPTIQSKSVELSALLILSAILIGLALGGPLGGVIAIPIAGCVRVIMLDQLEQARQKRQSMIDGKKHGGVIRRVIEKATSS